jgi:hypothetical protein
LAQAVLAGAGGASFSPLVNSRQENVRRAEKRVEKYFATLSKALFPIALLFPAVVVGLVIFALAREKVLGRSAVLGLGAAGLLVVILLLLPTPDWVETPLDKLGHWLEEIFESGGWTIGVLLLAGLTGLVGLGVRAWRRAEGLLGGQLLLYLAYAVLLPLLGFAAFATGREPGEPVIIALLVSYLLIPAAFLLRSAGYGVRRQGWAAAGALALSGFALVGTLLPVVALTLASGGMMVEGGAPGDVMLLQAGPMDGEVLRMPMALPAAEKGIVMVEEEGIESEQTAAEPPRLRQFFPETLFWLPEAVTDEGGHASVEIPIADSITTWRLSALASSQDGRLGAATVGLPVALTQGDEVSVPVAVYNYLPEAQRVRLELEPADWYTALSDQSTSLPIYQSTITIGADDVEVVYFRLRVERFGRHALQVTAWGQQQSDAIQKEVTVHPDGKRFDFAISDRLEPALGGAEGDGTDVETTIPIPAQAIPGTARVDVKIYPGILSQVVEGMESILRMPYGCFEQTTSATYPNVLVMDYMQNTD